MAKLIYVLCWLCRCSRLAIIAFGVEAVDAAVGQEKPAEPAVKALNNAVLSRLPFANRDDFQDAARGFIAT
jgi:alkyl sulfatase BDS1-like metallo-beta-lactamase superfamily hydrolase